MPFYEIIYETGAHSLASYDTDAEAAAAADSHNSRAVTGQPSGSDYITYSEAGDPIATKAPPAERVVKVLKYEEHPAEYNIAQTLSKEDAVKEVKKAIDNLTVADQVSAPELAGAIRDLTTPLIPDSGPHESNYKMAEVGVVWERDKNA